MQVQALTRIPDLPALAAAFPARCPVLLQSSGERGWDILMALPQERRVYHDAHAFLADVDALPVHAGAAGELPFAGGWALYAGYELLGAFEPTVPARALSAPVAALIRCPAAVLVDRAAQTAFIVAETAAQLAELAGLLAQAPVWQPRPLVVAAVSEDEPQAFVDGVAACKRYIVEGDVFQVNLSRGWDVTLAQGDAHDLYAALRRANPAPFSALFDLGESQIVSSSPERLVRVQGGIVDTRPIAGTHRRSVDPEEDAALKRALISTVKERAEHIMLVDLERNDLGRIAVPGSVEVDELMAVESYAYVHHIESNIRARLRPGTPARQILRALFPGGTITGCPKVRCMQIIRELEDRERGVYTGSLGYIGLDGRMDLNILIRSFLQTGPQLYFRAGAGIVADSVPARELEETRHKARGLLRALGVDG
ncbi:aminodeoxychorismate synthase component I [Jeongeupia sp. USM3]|uniref:aminodeoxychorismate synthase component I n=1 Tax=Jeongeupia sp. USM3 TaxID=1906741 RepID=UPI00089DFB3F|nr:aminodeoxychorismate synthase component I [Jeongeupia sp. USM3]AOY00173.1 aminodeoxychorismate synthase, component I [Jeongeupia sp. USM3]